MANLRDYGLPEALATNAARDAALDRYSITAEQRTRAIAAFADVTTAVDIPAWFEAYAAKHGWSSKA